MRQIADHLREELPHYLVLGSLVALIFLL